MNPIDIACHVCGKKKGEPCWPLAKGWRQFCAGRRRVAETGETPPTRREYKK